MSPKQRGDASTTEPEATYIHPLSSLVLDHLTNNHSTFLENNQLAGTVANHPDGTISVGSIARNRVRIWTSFEVEEKIHYLNSVILTNRKLKLESDGLLAKGLVVNSSTANTKTSPVSSITKYLSHIQNKPTTTSMPPTLHSITPLQQISGRYILQDNTTPPWHDCTKELSVPERVAYAVDSMVGVLVETKILV